MECEIYKKQDVSQDECLERILEKHRSKFKDEAELDIERQTLLSLRDSGVIAEFECFIHNRKGDKIYKIRLS